MSLDAQMEPHEKYLHVVVTGAFDFEELKELIRRIRAAAQQHGLSKILADFRNMDGWLSQIARFELASLAASDWPAPLRAGVLKTPAQAPDDNFFENVAVNRGAIIRISTKAEEIFTWLEIEPPSGLAVG